MVRSRCSLPKESSRIDETIENRVVRRMAVLVLFQLYRVDEGPNAARKRVRDTIAPLNKPTLCLRTH